MIHQSAHLLFWFRKSTASPDYGIIRMRVEMPGHPEANYSTGIKVFKKEWGGDRRRFLGDSEWAVQKNKLLKRMEIEMEQLQNFMQASGYTITPHLLMATYTNMAGKDLTLENIRTAASKQQPRHLTLLESVDWFMNNVKVEKTTMVTYESRQANLQRFLKHRNLLKLRAEDFTEALATSFCDWFLKQPNPNGGTLSQNYCYKHVIFFRKILDEARRRGLVTANPLERYKVEKEEKRDLRHLTMQQLEKLEELNLHTVQDRSLRSKLEKARDLFIFCCYTGFHYSDREALDSDHLRLRKGSLWIFKKRQKTKVEAKIKLHPKAVEILDKYDGVENLPHMEKNENNDLLKVLEMMIDVKIGLSTKIARKTFAHLCLNVWMIDRDTTATMMGLSTPKHINAYAEIEESRVENAVCW